MDPATGKRLNTNSLTATLVANNAAGGGWGSTIEGSFLHQTELKKALIGLVAPTHQEAGCLNYDLHVSPEDPAKFLFHENWTGKELLDAHLKSPHVAALLPRVDELCIGMPDIVVWEKIA